MFAAAMTDPDFKFRDLYSLKNEEDTAKEGTVVDHENVDYQKSFSL